MFEIEEIHIDLRMGRGLKYTIKNVVSKVSIDPVSATNSIQGQK